MNQNRDALIDTTGAVIRIDEIKEVQLSRYRVCGYVGGVKRVIISEHKDLEDAKKAILLIHLAAGAGLDTWDFDGDMSKMDDAIRGLRGVAAKKTLKVFRGE
jgi:hypothetical protein